MKTKLSRFLILAALVLAVCSCADETENQGSTGVVKPVERLMSPIDGAQSAVVLTTEMTVKFEWLSAKTEGDAKVTYAVLFDKVGGNFSNPLARIAADNSGKSLEARIPQSELNKVCTKADIAPGKSGDFIWTVVAINNGAQEVNATQTFKIAISNTPDNTITPVRLFIYGDATETGPSIANAMEFLSFPDAQFDLFMQLKAGGKYRLSDSKDATGKGYYAASDGVIRMGNLDMAILKTALYRINIDFKTKKITLTEVVDFGLFYPIQGAQMFELNYKGNGEWRDTSYIAMEDRDWGKEGRYKFRMKLKDPKSTNTTQMFFARKATDNSTAIAPHGGEDVWQDVFGFDEARQDRKRAILTVKHQGNELVHSFEVLPLDEQYWQRAADQSSRSFAEKFWNSSGFFNQNIYGLATNPHDYWPQAHATDVMIDAYLRTKDNLEKKADNDFYKQRIADFHQGVKNINGGGFKNHFYDDMAWHGLTHLRALEATGDTRWEQSAKDLWLWLVEGWDENEGGGILWNADPYDPAKNGKGVPSNGPACIIATRRWVKYGASEIVKGETNLQWAQKIYSWMRANRYVTETGRVYERLDDKGGDWTYNAGTFMGSAMELYDVTGDQMYFNDAVRTADYGIKNLINSHTKVLSDWAEQPNHDVNLFKAVFVRYFTRLIMHPNLSPSKKAEYVTFMKNNAHYLWDRGSVKSPAVLYNFAWYRKPLLNEVFLRAQVSGAAMIEATALLHQKGYLTTEY